MSRELSLLYTSSFMFVLCNKVFRRVVAGEVISHRRRVAIRVDDARHRDTIKVAMSHDKQKSGNATPSWLRTQAQVVASL